MTTNNKDYKADKEVLKMIKLVRYKYPSATGTNEPCTHESKDNCNSDTGWFGCGSTPEKCCDKCGLTFANNDRIMVMCQATYNTEIEVRFDLDFEDEPNLREMLTFCSECYNEVVPVYNIGATGYETRNFDQTINAKDYPAFDCIFVCDGCGFLPHSRNIREDEGKFTAFCETCENTAEFYECLRVYKSRGAHDKCIGTYPLGKSKRNNNER